MPLAELGVSALEYWNENLNDQFLSNLNFILPLLNEYLKLILLNMKK